MPWVFLPAAVEGAVGGGAVGGGAVGGGAVVELREPWEVAEGWPGNQQLYGIKQCSYI